MTNNDIYDFISKEISKHPELQSVTKEDLMKHEDDFDYWDELCERLDCLRICDACQRPMIEGFCIDDGREHYCSEQCLHRFIRIKNTRRCITEEKEIHIGQFGGNRNYFKANT